MLNFITRYFTSLWAFLTWPFRMIWRGVRALFPAREFTIMDVPTGNVYSFQQNSFWRFTKFCGKTGLVLWAAWSTYVFVYHRPLLQKRTQQLAEETERHDRHMVDLQTYLAKYNSLTQELTVIDDKILNDKKLTDTQKEEMATNRAKIWGELNFLHSRLTEMFSNEDYSAEYTKLAELSMEYELTHAENEALKKRDTELVEAMVGVASVDIQIVDMVTKLTADNKDELHAAIKKISSTISSLGLSEKGLVESANKYSSPVVGSAFSPLDIDKDADPKYQKLADGLEMWHGLSRLKKILPLGAPVKKVRITSNYGTREDPFGTDQKKKHKGIDFAGKIGTELLAVAPGRVVSAGERVGYGTTVEIDHGLGFTTLYAHLSHINVSRGDWVRPGTIIGLAGSSGRSTGPHLHYEIRFKGQAFDPTKFVKE